MNRRSFLAGLLASTALPAMPAPSFGRSPLVDLLPPLRMCDVMARAASQRIAVTLVYGTDESPTQFTGLWEVSWGEASREIFPAILDVEPCAPDPTVIFDEGELIEATWRRVL